jgi:hypothetical protein
MADPRKPSSSSFGRRRGDGEASVGEFIIGSEIGKGSFAQVYMGVHKVSESSLPFNLARKLPVLRIFVSTSILPIGDTKSTDFDFLGLSYIGRPSEPSSLG